MHFRSATPLFCRIPPLASLLAGAAILVLVVLATTGVASASRVAANGTGLAYTGNAAGGNWLIVTSDFGAPNEAVFVDSEPIELDHTVCYRGTWDDPEMARCLIGSHLTITTGNGNDTIQIYERSPAAITVRSGAGNDDIEALNYTRPITLLGGAGNDRIRGGSGNDVIDGGPGHDYLEGNDGNDRVLGGPGNDRIAGDALVRGNDVIDGGAGIDSITYDWRRPYDPGKLRLTLDGKANDGLPGERDNVRNVERFVVDRQVSFKAGRQPVHLTIFTSHPGGSRITGSRKGDRITADGGNDRIRGGKGNDVIIGGYGDDVIVGGPGRDKINSGLGRSCDKVRCPLTTDNDTIKVRDGERDSVKCGPGRDKVIADQFDRVAKDCEVVKRKRVKKKGRKR